jgi:hypothetical protein
MCIQPATSAVVVQYDSIGLVTGATGVTFQVGGETATYNVTFTEGSCVDLFSKSIACDPDAFAFTTLVDASAASQALLDSVFTGDLDLAPSFTTGCRFTYCVAVTPYDTVEGGTDFMLYAGARNESGLTLDSVVVERNLFSWRTVNDAAYTFAVWTRQTVTPPPPPSPTPVPEPATAVLVGSALLAMRLLSKSGTRAKSTEYQ